MKGISWYGGATKKQEILCWVRRSVKSSEEIVKVIVKDELEMDRCKGREGYKYVAFKNGFCMTGK